MTTTRSRRPSTPRRPRAASVAATLDRAARDHAAGRLAQSFAACTRVLELEPANASALYRLSQIARERGHADMALEFIAAACKADCGRAELHLEHARVQVALGELAAAEGALLEAERLGAKAGAQAALAELFLAARRFTDVANCVARALAAGGDDAAILRRMGRLQVSLGHIAEAAATLERAVRLDPDDVEARHTLALVHLRLGDDVAAHGELTRCMALDPSDRLDARAALNEIAKRRSLRLDTVFDDTALRHGRRLRCLVERIVGAKRHRLTTLELGCGSGETGPVWRALARTLVGVEADERRAAEARGRCLYDDVLCGQAETLLATMPAALFDLVASPAALTRSFSLSPIFAGAAHVLRPGGLFALGVHADARGAEVAILPGRRFRHSDTYVRRLAGAYGFDVASVARVSDTGRSGMTTLLIVLQKKKPPQGPLAA
jgi:predicted TPR repeat methyltransferase